MSNTNTDNLREVAQAIRYRRKRQVCGGVDGYWVQLSTMDKLDAVLDAEPRDAHPDCAVCRESGTGYCVRAFSCPHQEVTVELVEPREDGPQPASAGDEERARELLGSMCALLSPKDAGYPQPATALATIERILLFAAATRREERERYVFLRDIEHACHARYSRTCPYCHASRGTDLGYVERGPDDGHEAGCVLKAAIRALDDAEREKRCPVREVLGGALQAAVQLQCSLPFAHDGPHCFIRVRDDEQEER